MRPKALSPVTLVRLLRRRSQREIAHAIGISRARLSQIEAGNEPPYTLMRKLAAELESDVDVLFPEDGGKELREKLRADLGLKRKKRRAES
jgi:transcriptional regulator with XRE-family HTH domain